jgi:hypothetical protein
MFVNNEKELKLDAYLAFTKTTNVIPEGSTLDKETGEPCYHVVLNPGEEKAIHLRRKEINFKFGIAYKSSFKMLGLSESPRKLL